MSLNLIPKLKGHGGRRAIDKVTELREENRKLLTRQMAADDFFALLMQDRDQLYAAWRWAEQQRQEAEMVAACTQSEMEEWRDEALRLRAQLAPYKAAEANANRVTVPPIARIGADQDTTSVDVTALWDAAEAGLLPGCGPGRIT